MIVHIFNSSVVSGPETLAIPALKNLGEPVGIVFLIESRLEEASKGPVKYARDLGHEVYTVQVRGRWDRKAFRELRELLDRLSPRIAHAHDVKASLYLLKAARVKPGFKPKLASTHHGTVARKGKIRVYEEIYVRLILPKFDAVLVVCEIDRQSVLRRGLSENKVFIHHNGVDRPKVAPQDRESAQREIQARWRATHTALPEPGAAIFLGAVARLSDEKRHDRMLRALQTVKREHPKLRFALCCFGIGALDESLKALTQKLGMEDRVFWMGYSKTIGQEMAGFDLLLCLSDGEGVPINLLEAGWAGTPVFSTRVGGIPDVITSEVGYLVEKSESDEAIGHAIAQAINGRSERERKGQAYQQLVESKFSEAAWLERLRQIYSQ